MGGWYWGAMSSEQLSTVRSQMQSQQEFLERMQPKGPLWFWEHTTNPYLELWATPNPHLELGATPRLLSL